MRIVKREEFLKLLAGTLFQKYNNGAFGSLSVKQETTHSGKDFYLIDLSDPSFVEADGDISNVRASTSWS